MTSSFSNMMLAIRYCFSHNLDEVKAELEDVITAAENTCANDWNTFKNRRWIDFNCIIYLEQTT